MTAALFFPTAVKGWGPSIESRLGIDPERALDRRLDARIIWFHILAFGAGGTAKPFINLYFLEIGLREAQIGFLQGLVSAGVAMTTPALGYLADRTQQFRRLLALSSFTKGLGAFLLPLNTAWNWLIGAHGLRALSAGTQNAIMTRLTLRHIEDSPHIGFGSVRFWGMLSMAVTSVVGGILVRDRSIAILFPISGFLSLLSLIFVGGFPSKVTDDVQAPAHPKELGRSPSLLLLFALIFFFNLSWIGPDTFAYVYLADDLGAPNDFIGYLGGINMLSRLLGFRFADSVLDRLGPANTLGAAIALHIAAWLGFAAISDPSPALFFSLLLGVAWSLYFVSMVVILERVSASHQSGVDQMFAMNSLPMAAAMVGQPLSGWLLEQAGGPGMFLVVSLLAVLTLLILFRGRQHLRRR